MKTLPNPSATDGSQIQGISFNAEVDIPAPFTGDGVFCFIQKITPQRIQLGSTQNEAYSLNGDDVLDTSAPYGTGFPGVPTMFPTGTSSNGLTGDAPDQSVDDPYIEAIVSGESFETYLMFVPPGPGSQPVTVSRATWNWSGTLHYSYDALTSMIDYWLEARK